MSEMNTCSGFVLTDVCMSSLLEQIYKQVHVIIDISARLYVNAPGTFNITQCEHSFTSLFKC